MAVQNFDSLRETLQDAIQKKHGKDAYLSDFSPTHAIFRKPGEKTDRMAPYTITNTGGAHIGKHVNVKRVSGYERVRKAAKAELESKTLGAPDKGTLQD